MRKFNKMIAAMMTMAITVVTPAMASSNTHGHGRKDRVVVVVNNDRKARHDAAHRHHVHRLDIRTCTFNISRHQLHAGAVERAKRIHGVKDVHYNPYTHELLVRYDARITTARHIVHRVNW